MGVMPARKRRKTGVPGMPGDPYREMWISLAPAERLRRSWRMRARLRNLQAIHDEKSLPKL